MGWPAPDRKADESSVREAYPHMRICKECSGTNGGHYNTCSSYGGSDKVVEKVNHPSHYGGGEDPFEFIKVAEAKLSREEFIGAMKFTAGRYLDRAGKKDGEPLERDCAKAAWYTARLAEYLKKHPA